MESSSRLYINEITNFLKCIVIKFDPFVTILNNKLEYQTIEGFDEYDLKTYPYYRILAGDAAFATEDLYGYSPESKSEILLTQENLTLHQDVVTFYREPTNLKILLTRYPNDQFLIRRILNPVVDIEAAISAKNLTLLQTTYDDQFLNQYERSDLILFLQDMLWRIDYRWYISPFEFEDLYPLAFWSMLWSVLPNLLLTKRILNIKTNHVHPFHIWEYLGSLGFGSYKGYLSHSQELFMYRNALYLKFNAGKKSLLDTLENVFLTPLLYSLSKKTIISHTVGREEYHDKRPDVVPETGDVDKYLSSTTFDSFLKNIYTEGHDIQDDESYRNTITDKFGKASTNKLATKFLEFDRNIDVSEMTLLLRFILDSTVYLSHKNKLQFNVDVISPISQNILHFDSVVDALDLMFYCIYMKEGPPTETFKRYTLTTAVTHTSPPETDEYFYDNGVQYFTQSYVDVDSIVGAFPYVSADIYSAADLSNILGDHYVWIFGMINKLKSISGSVEHEGHVNIFKTLIPDHTVIDVQQNHDTYTEYFTRYPEALLEINKIVEDDQFGEFIYAIISGICPLDYGFSALARDDQVISILIHKIKELFMYMVSYNITFINKVFEQSSTFELPKPAPHIVFGVNGDGWWEPGWWENNIPDKPIVYNIQINSAIDIRDDKYNTHDYRVSITTVDDVDLALDLDIEVSCGITETSTVIDSTPEPNESDFSNVTAQSIIYITESGVDLKFINHLI